MTKEKKCEEMGRSECKPTSLGYILEALLRLCLDSILFPFISDVFASFRDSYIQYCIQNITCHAYLLLLYISILTKLSADILLTPKRRVVRPRTSKTSLKMRREVFVDNFPYPNLPLASPIGTHCKVPLDRKCSWVHGSLQHSIMNAKKKKKKNDNNNFGALHAFTI